MVNIKVNKQIILIIIIMIIHKEVINNMIIELLIKINM